MKKYLMTSAALALCGSAAFAGGIDRNGQPIGLIFEETGASGSYMQLSFASVTPEANGDFSLGAAAALVGGTPGATGTASPLNSYSQLGFGFKKQINDAFSLSLIYDQPFGASVEYDSGAPFLGGTAEITSRSFTVLGRYELGNGFSVHGGVRALALDGEIFTPKSGAAPGSLAPALLEADSGYDFGTVVGVAYERPEIALRVALTYSSAINVGFSGTEATLALPDPSAPVAVGPVDTEFDLEFPASVNLDVQSGIAENTLAFGTIRWVGWDGFNLTTDGTGIPTAADSEYVNFDSDTITYTIGVGRRINENLSVAISYTYEDRGDEPSTTALAPTTGIQSIALSGSYKMDDGVTLSGGITYGTPGNQIVTSPFDDDGEVEFDDNKVIGVGLRIGYAF